jgi:hypothetical protein
VSTEPADPAERLNWPWLSGCVIVGLGLNGAALAAEAWWKWTGVFPSILVNLGTAVLLVAVFFRLERRFTRRVVDANRGALRQAAQQIEEHLQSRTDALSTRIDDLQRQVDARMQARARQGDEKVANLVADVSYPSVTAALTEANDLGAVYWGRIAVQASDDIDGAKVVFKWGMEADPSQYVATIRPPRLEVEVLFEADFDRRGGRRIMETEWRPEEQIQDVAERLNRTLQNQGRWTSAGTLNWTMVMANLQRGLGLAIASRRDGETAGPWRLNGALYELVGTDWPITTAGIESREENRVVLEEAEFPDTRFRRNDYTEADQEWNPPPPEGISAGDWARLIRRGRRVHPQWHGPMIHTPSWYAWTTDLAAQLQHAERGRQRRS